MCVISPEGFLCQVHSIESKVNRQRESGQAMVRGWSADQPRYT